MAKKWCRSDSLRQNKVVKSKTHRGTTWLLLFKTNYITISTIFKETKKRITSMCKTAI